jgi:hypothetical protein
MASLVERNDVNELLKQGLAEQNMIFGRMSLKGRLICSTLRYSERKKIFFFGTTDFSRPDN